MEEFNKSSVELRTKIIELEKQQFVNSDTTKVNNDEVSENTPVVQDRIA